MPRVIRFTIGRKIYGTIALSFIGLIAVALFTVSEMSAGLQVQKQTELAHLTELALGIAKEEHAAAQKGVLSNEEAQKRAAARIGTLRYGNNDYFWINDMHPRLVMHPLRPEMVGRDMSDSKDANGEPLYTRFAATVKDHGAGFVRYDQLKPGIRSRSRSCPVSSALRRGAG